MISGLVRTWLFAMRPARLSSDSEVVYASDPEHGVMDAVTLEAAVAEDLPSLHAGEGVLDASSDLLVGLVVRLLPVGQVFAFAAAVGHDESGARIAAVSDRECLADGGPGAGLLPCLAVVAIAGERPADHDDQADVGVDDDLVIGRVPIVLRLRRDGDRGWARRCRPR